MRLEEAKTSNKDTRKATIRAIPKLPDEALQSAVYTLLGQGSLVKWVVWEGFLDQGANSNSTYPGLLWDDPVR